MNNKNKQRYAIRVFVLMLVLMTMFTSSLAFADGNGSLDGVSTQETTTDSTDVINANSSDTEVVAGLFDMAGIDEEDIAAANTMLLPVAKLVNKAVAVILGLAILGMFLITAIDMLYMAIPPLRNLLDGQMSRGQGQGQQGGGMMGGMGGRRGGMGGGMMGGGMMGGGMMGGGMMGGNGMTGQGEEADMTGFTHRWISDDALAAVREAQGGMVGSQPGMMGGMGGGQPSEPPKVKSILLLYFKKRLVFYVLFGVCVTVFSTTVLTNLGVVIGLKFLAAIMGIH